MAGKPIAPLLPLKEEELDWAVGASVALEELGQGPQVSRVASGESLVDFMVDLRHRCGIKDFGLPSKAAQGLIVFFTEFLPEQIAREFFTSLLPLMARLVLKLPGLLKSHFESSTMHKQAMDLRVLPAGQRGMVLISQELASCIVACGFFCLFPSAGREKLGLPDINFQKLFIALLQGENQAHKLLCILHYFHRVCEKMPQGLVSYERKVLWIEGMEVPDSSFWSSSSMPLCQLLVIEDGTIEGNEAPALEVDFANKYLGGGVLGYGCLQEEIRFIINPELIAGRLFLSAMGDNEAIEIVGSERYSRYEGYASTFSHAGNFSDDKPRDSWGRKSTHIIAIDALPHPGERQFDQDLMLRELNKAFCGFLDQHSKPESKTGSVPGVATGNWGCGVFGGDHEVKSMLQWLAASEAGRPFLLYYTFKDHRTRKLQQVADWILLEKWCVWDLWNVLIEYGKRRKSSVATGFFDWFLPHLQDQQ